MKLEVNLPNNQYEIIIEKASINNLKTYLPLSSKVLVVTDSGIPKIYVETVLNSYQDSYLVTIEQGEKNKNYDNYLKIIDTLASLSFTRTDAVIAVGGGVVGDLAAFATSTYMRGIAFYNIPTTLLSQVDSSIGGKTGIDFKGYKNLIGTFYQPKKVIIDPFTLNTLSARLFNEGLAEVIKMALCFDQDLFNVIKNSTNIKDDIEEIIIKALQIKKRVVEQDEKEQGLRRVLNYGHTLGHAFEALMNGALYHGEAVAIGMMYMASYEVKKELNLVLTKFNLPTNIKLSYDEVIEKVKKDKKKDQDEINIVYVNKIGSFEIRKIKIDDLKEYYR